MDGNIINIENITGSLSEVGGLDGEISNNEIIGSLSGGDEISGSLSETSDLNGDLAHGFEAIDYDGEYVVTPKSTAQSLETKFKTMGNNVTVAEIPYYETANISGTTVYIGD